MSQVSLPCLPPDLLLGRSTLPRICSHALASVFLLTQRPTARPCSLVDATAVNTSGATVTSFALNVYASWPRGDQRIHLHVCYPRLLSSSFPSASSHPHFSRSCAISDAENAVLPSSCTSNLRATTASTPALQPGRIATRALARRAVCLHQERTATTSPAPKSIDVDLTHESKGRSRMYFIPKDILQVGASCRCCPPRLRRQWRRRSLKSADALSCVVQRPPPRQRSVARGHT